MATYRIELRDDGIRALMRSQEVAHVLDEQAERLAAQANSNAGKTLYGIRPTKLLETRGIALVVPEDLRGRIDEAKRKSLSRAVSQCRS